MVEFIKFPKIQNHHRARYIEKWFKHKPSLIKEQFIVSEKLDGMNFQVMIDEDYIKFASRNRVVSDFPKEDPGEYKRVVQEQYAHFWQGFQGLCQVTDGIDTIHVFGELYGQGIRGSNQGWHQNEDKDFKVFEIWINGEPLPVNSGQFVLRGMWTGLRPDVTAEDAERKQLVWVPTWFISNYMDVMKTTVEDKPCEGVIIQPYKSVHINPNNGDIFRLKKKSDANP